MTDIYCFRNDCTFNKKNICTAAYINVGARAICLSSDPPAEDFGFKPPAIKTVIQTKCRLCGEPCYVYGFIRPEQTATEVLQGTGLATCSECEPDSQWKRGTG